MRKYPSPSPEPEPEPEPEPPTPTGEDPQLTASPTSFNNSNLQGGKSVTIQLSYLGTGEITLSGKKPYHTTPTYDSGAKTITIAGNSGYNYYGGTLASIMTVNLSASTGYNASSVDITFTASSATQVEDI